MNEAPTPHDGHLTKRERRMLRKQEKLQERRTQTKKQTTVRWLAVGVAIVLLGGGIWWYAASQGTPSSADGAPDTDPAKGPGDAAVVVREYSDFQCPACKGAEPVLKKMIEAYGDRVRFEYNDFPLTTIHKNGQQAAEAGQCAFVQDKFWEYHDTLFAQQEAWSGKSGDDARQAFLGYAKDLGLDEAVFTRCLADGATKGSIASDVADARRKGVNSTPTFFVNDEKLVGVPKEADFKAAIEAALGK